MRKELTVTVDAWGNIIVAGPIKGGQFDETFVAKLDKDGNMLWQRGLFSARTSSLPPPPILDAAAASEPRDSVEPHLLDEVARYEHTLSRSRPFLSVWRAFGAAALVAFGVAGVALAAQRAATAPQTSLRVHSMQREAPTAGALEARVAAPGGDAPIPEAAIAESNITLPLPDPASLRAETLALLTAGFSAKALPSARSFVAAVPHDAISYLFLGAALQDLGRANEAREVYNDCVKLATTGDASDCYALGGRR